MLIFFRVLQGAGGGGLRPSEQAILADTFSESSAEWPLRSMAWRSSSRPSWTNAWVVGSLITTDWHWIFFINVPIGIVSLLLTHKVVHDPPYLKNIRRAGARIDYWGMGSLLWALGSCSLCSTRGRRKIGFRRLTIVIEPGGGAGLPAGDGAGRMVP